MMAGAPTGRPGRCNAPVVAAFVRSPPAVTGRAAASAATSRPRMTVTPRTSPMTDTAQHTEDRDVQTQGREAIPDVARQLKAIDTCMFVTRGERGELHARPMSNNGQVEWDGSSWF